MDGLVIEEESQSKQSETMEGWIFVEKHVHQSETKRPLSALTLQTGGGIEIWGRPPFPKHDERNPKGLFRGQGIYPDP